MAGRRHHHLAGRRVELAEQTGRQPVEAEELPAPLERGDELDRTVDLAGQGPGGAAQVAHQGRRVAVVTGDVADHEPDPAAR